MAHYVAISPSRRGGISPSALAASVLGSVAVFAASLFLAVYLTQRNMYTEKDPPPAPLPVAPIRADSSHVPMSEIQMALMFIQAQKSGNLSSDHPVTWRGPSGVLDGTDQNRNLSGGYYTDGSNIKHHFPMAFSMTMLSWALLEYESVFKGLGVDREITELITWGVDYLLRTKYENVYFTQVGNPDVDVDRSGAIQCWTRPEDMTPRQRQTMYPCDITHPCSDLAGEYAAAFAAASLVYRIGNPEFADELLDNAKETLEFADTFRGKYSDQLGHKAGKFGSHTFEDEILWGAAWVYLASNDTAYLDEYLLGPRLQAWKAFSWPNEVFSWNNKWPAIQVLMSRILLLGDGARLRGLKKPSQAKQMLNYYHTGAQRFVCHYMTAVKKTPGNLMWLNRTDHPLQYPINAGFLSLVLAEYERAAAAKTRSPGYLAACGVFSDAVRGTFLRQKEYILGDNPMRMSYMVGFLGEDLTKRSPGYIHHRGSSIPAKQGPKDSYTCAAGLQFLWSKFPNPNLMYGALVGGPAQDDSYLDDRLKQEQSEPYLHVNAVFIGMLAALNASASHRGNNLTRIFAAMNPSPVFAFASKLQEHRQNMSSTLSSPAKSVAAKSPIVTATKHQIPRDRSGAHPTPAASQKKQVEKQGARLPIVPKEELRAQHSEHSRPAHTSTPSATTTTPAQSGLKEEAKVEESRPQRAESSPPSRMKSKTINPRQFSARPPQTVDKSLPPPLPLKLPPPLNITPPDASVLAPLLPVHPQHPGHHHNHKKHHSSLGDPVPEGTEESSDAGGSDEGLEEVDGEKPRHGDDEAEAEAEQGEGAEGNDASQGVEEETTEQGSMEGQQKHGHHHHHQQHHHQRGRHAMEDREFEVYALNDQRDL